MNTATRSPWARKKKSFPVGNRALSHRQSKGTQTISRRAIGLKDMTTSMLFVPSLGTH